MICNALTRNQSNKLYDEILRAPNNTKALRQLCREDLFFLITIGFMRKDVNHPWLYERCREVEANPNGYLDLWARDHYKSTIQTYGKTIQDILSSHGDDPLPFWNGREVTAAIFSHTRPIAKGFLDQIKREFEDNDFLKDLFPDVLYKNPKSEAPKWSQDNGLIVKRKSNPKEATLEAWGLVDGQPTSRHFLIKIYDDVVTRESVTTSDQIKKTTEAWELSDNLGTKGGYERYIGTRYHFNDTWSVIIKRKAAKPRIHAATTDGTMKGEPVFLSMDQLIKKRETQGPYTFACHGKRTRITMADWTHKAIEDVKVGDMVVGWEFGKNGSKATLKPTKVLAVNSRVKEAIKSTLKNGHVLIHTKDHKWWTGRAPNSERNLYSPLGFGNGHQKGLCQLHTLTSVITQDKYKAAGYLAAIIDGEGSVSSGCVRISQDYYFNPIVCKNIEWALDTLGFDYNIFQKKRDNRIGTQRDYCIRGGRQAKIDLLNYCKGILGKAGRIVASCFSARNFGKGSRVALQKQEGVGRRKVYNIQTETGNYIAEGYCSKNCQMLQNPKEDSVMGFEKEWLMFYDKLRNFKNWNFYLLCDPAGEKKKENDYTVITVIALAPDGNFYLVDGIRDRLNLTERTDKIFELHRKWRPLKTGYEKYGKDSDIEHIEYEMAQQNYRFSVTPLGGGMPKNDRIRRLVPPFEQRRFYIPHTLHFVTRESKVVDFINDFINDEYIAFPVTVHDDMLDCMSRILDPKLGAVFPEYVRHINSMTSSKEVNTVETEYNLFP